MKKVLKGWLIDNSVTTDNKTDKILLLHSTGSLDLDDVLEEMQKQDTGLRPETMRHSVTLYNRVLTDLILNGYSVNTGLFRAVAQLTGVIEGGVWNKEKNSIYVSFTQDKALREAIAQTAVEILGEKSNIMYILETEDKKTGLKDGSATAGRNFFVRGAMLKVVGDHESVGVTLTNEAKAVTKLTDDLITINNPSSLTLLLPADLAEGEYTLTVMTQFANSGHMLKTPRILNYPFLVFDMPKSMAGDGGISKTIRLTPVAECNVSYKRGYRLSLSLYSLTGSSASDDIGTAVGGEAGLKEIIQAAKDGNVFFINGKSDNINYRTDLSVNIFSEDANGDLSISFTGFGYALWEGLGGMMILTYTKSSNTFGVQIMAIS